MSNTPKLRFKEFNDEWSNKSLKELFLFKNGLNKEKEFFGKGTPIINFTDVYKNRGLKSRNIKGLVEVTEKELENYNVSKGDVFFTRTSETIDDIGMTTVVLDEVKDTVFSGFVLRARPKNAELANGFKKYCFSTYNTRKEIITKSSFTTRALTSGALLNEVNINYPSLPEQEKIASFLSLFDEKIELQEKKIESLKKYKKGTMQKIFSQEIRFKDENGENYPEWEEKRIDEISDIYQPKTISQSDFTDSGYVVYGANGSIGFYSKYNHDTEQIAVTCRGNTCGTINFTPKFVWITGNAMVVNTDNYMNDVVKEYLKYILTFSNLKYLITGSGQPQITRESLITHKIKLPNIKEQEKIANFLSTIDSKIELEQKKLDKLKEYKKGLLQQMFV